GGGDGGGLLGARLLRQPEAELDHLVPRRRQGAGEVLRIPLRDGGGGPFGHHLRRLKTLQGRGDGPDLGLPLRREHVVDPGVVEVVARIRHVERADDHHLDGGRGESAGHDRARRSSVRAISAPGASLIGRTAIHLARRRNVGIDPGRRRYFRRRCGYLPLSCCTASSALETLSDGLTPPMVVAIFPSCLTMKVVRSANPWPISSPLVFFAPALASATLRS